jgi:hypothetical protein
MRIAVKRAIPTDVHPSALAGVSVNERWREMAGNRVAILRRNAIRSLGSSSARVHGWPP